MLMVREIERRDIQEINRWRADHVTVDFLGAPYRYIGPEVDEAWFDKYLEMRSSTIRCVTYDTQNADTPLCLTSLSNIDWVNRTATLQIQVGNEAARGKGVGSFSMKQMLKHGFNDMGLHRIELEVLESNDRARRLYEKSGFCYEGTKRQAVFKNGMYVNMLTMAILKDEWRERFQEGE